MTTYTQGFKDGAEAVAKRACKNNGTGQCAAICLSHSSLHTKPGKCPEMLTVWVGDIIPSAQPMPDLQVGQTWLGSGWYKTILKFHPKTLQCRCLVKPHGSDYLSTEKPSSFLRWIHQSGAVLISDPKATQ